MATARSKKDNSTTATPYARSTEDSSTAFSAQQNGISNSDNIAALIKLYSENINKINKLSSRIEALEDVHHRQDQLYMEISKTSKVSRISIIILMIVPLIQLIVCWLIIVHYGKQEQLPNLLNYFLGGISILSIIEAALVPIKMYFDKRKNDEFDSRIKQLEEKSNQQ